MMISPLADGRILIVLQMDHSRVAGAVVAHWGNDVFAEPSPFFSVTVAAGAHDSGWLDWEIKPTVNQAGEVVDYHVWWDWESADYYRGPGVLGKTWVDYTTRWIERLAERDPYAAVLVSMHHAGMLNGGFGKLPHMKDRTQEPAAADFVRRQSELQSRLRKDVVPAMAGVSSDDLDEEAVVRNWKLVQVGDQFAQLLCNRHPFNSQERKTGPKNALPNVPLRPGVADTTLRFDIKDETSATVDPWPFDVDRLAFHVPARILPKARYDDRDAFLRDYLKAEQITVPRVLTRR